MRTIRIRTLTILSLFFITLMPWLFYVSAHFLTTNSLSLNNNDVLIEDMQEIIHFIEAHSESWYHPTWQAELRTHLQETGIGVKLLSEANEEIFQYSTEEKRSFRRLEQFSLIEDGQVLGKIVIAQPNSRQAQMISALAGLLLAFVIIGFVIQRFILKPLETMSQAVRQVAKGDFDVQLPFTPIKEITEVQDGINVMTDNLKKSLQKQLELEEQRRFVIAAVAHDLRTPLFALRGYLDGLEQGIAHSPDKMAKYLAVCKNKTAQLDRLVEDLFTFAKTEYAEIELKKAEVNVAFLLQKSIDSFNALAQQQQISITAEFIDDCIVIGDSYLLERTINNLLDNAIRHTPKAGKIYVECHCDADYVIFTIRDTGEGFSSEEIKRVFEPLYRGEGSRNRSTGGAGLGLAIARKIIRQHGGELVAENHFDGGAVLQGQLPAFKSKFDSN